MPGIATKYEGITYRSRLEARWAVFFDLAGWQWEYEPIDGNGYIPDFVVMGARPMVVEVKPDFDLHSMEDHCFKIEAGLDGVWAGDVLIVGSTPFPGGPCPSFEGTRIAGLLGERNGWDGWEGWAWGPGIWAACPGDERTHEHCTSPNLRIIHDFQSFTGRPCGHHGGGHHYDPELDVEQLWRVAGERVRWKPRT